MSTSIVVLASFGLLHLATLFLIPRVISETSPLLFLRHSWGFNALSFLPIWTAFLAYVVFGLTLLTPTRERLGRAILSFDGWWSKGRTKLVLAGVLSWIPFWLFRQKYAFLGDGYDRVADIEAGRTIAQGALILRVLTWISEGLQIDALLTVQMASTFCGAFYVILSLLLARRLSNSFAGRISALGVLLFSGVIQLYFGYVETYAPLPIFILLFVIVGLKSVEHPVWAIAAGAVCVVSVVLHPITAILVPAAVYLLYRSGTWRVSNTDLFLLLCLGLMLAVWAGWTDTITRRMLPLLPAAQPYAMLTLINVWERLNGLILCAPALLPTIGLSILARRSPAGVTASSSFLGVLAISSGGALFSLNFILGSQDWDLMAVSSLPLVIYGGHLAGRLHQNASPVSTLQTQSWIVIPLLALASISTASWIWVNHTDASIQRLESILIDDPAEYYRHHDPAVRAAHFLSTGGLTNRGIEVLERSLQRSPDDAFVAYVLSAYLHRTGRNIEAIEHARHVLQMKPSYVYAFRVLIRAMKETDGATQADSLLASYPDSLVAAAARAGARNDDRSASTFAAAALLIGGRDSDRLLLIPSLGKKLVLAFREAAHTTMPIPIRELPDSTKQLALSAQKAKHYGDAVALYRAAIEMGEIDPVLVQNLGGALFAVGDADGGESTLRRGLERFPGNADIAHKLGLMQAASRRWNEAEESLRQALFLGKKTEQVYSELGRVLEAVGKPVEAARIYSAGLEQSQESTILREALNRLSSVEGTKL